MKFFGYNFRLLKLALQDTWLLKCWNVTLPLKRIHLLGLICMHVDWYYGNWLPGKNKTFSNFFFANFVKLTFSRCVINHTQHDQNIINDDGGVIAVEEYKLPYEAEISHNPSIGKANVILTRKKY